LITAYSLQPHEEEEVMAQAGADLLLYKPLPEPDEFPAAPGERAFAASRGRKTVRVPVGRLPDLTIARKPRGGQDSTGQRVCQREASSFMHSISPARAWPAGRGSW
jgi:hypothetical protein